MTSIVSIIFPGVRTRFEKSAAWHKEKHGIEPEWGLFWNFCINAPFAGAKLNGVSCTPHADHKNGVSVCVMLIYAMPWGKPSPSFASFYSQLRILHKAKFNHTQRTWLVIWEAGVVVELPPWVIAIYPSSLFYHFNIDVHGRWLQTPLPNSCY